MWIWASKKNNVEVWSATCPSPGTSRALDQQLGRGFSTKKLGLLPYIDTEWSMLMGHKELRWHPELTQLTKKFYSSFLVPWGFIYIYTHILYIDLSLLAGCCDNHHVIIDPYCPFSLHLQPSHHKYPLVVHQIAGQPRLPWRAISWVWPVFLANKPWASVWSKFLGKTDILTRAGAIWNMKRGGCSDVMSCNVMYCNVMYWSFF